MSNSFNQNDIRSQIMSAFGHLTYPGDEHIFLDSDDPDQQEWLGVLHSRHWTNIDRDYEAVSGSLWEFTPEAFQFYLPGFMLYCIERSLHTDVYGILLDTLNPPDDLQDDWSTSRFNNRLLLLTGVQRNTIALFWKFLRERYQKDWPEGEFDLTHFWDRFL